MKILQQFLIILAISFVSEMIYRWLHLPIPTSIYGFIIMFILLYCKILTVEKIADVAYFLLTAMQIMFIPAGVGVINAFPQIKSQLGAIFVLIFLSTLIVAVVTGKIADYILTREKKEHD